MMYEITDWIGSVAVRQTADIKRSIEEIPCCIADLFLEKRYPKSMTER